MAAGGNTEPPMCLQSFPETDAVVESINLNSFKDKQSLSNPNLQQYISDCIQKSLEQTEPPQKTNGQFYDAAIVFADADRELAVRVKEFLNGLVLKNGEHPKVCLFDSEEFGGSEVKRPKTIIDNCSFIFPLLTDNFESDKKVQFLKEETVAETRLGSRTNWQEYCVRPLHTQPRNGRKYPIPFGLAAVASYEVSEFNATCTQILTELFDYHISARKKREDDSRKTKLLKQMDDRDGLSFNLQTINSRKSEPASTYRTEERATSGTSGARERTDNVGPGTANLSEPLPGRHASDTQPLSEVGLLNDYVTMDKNKFGNVKSTASDDLHSADGTELHPTEILVAESNGLKLRDHESRKQEESGQNTSPVGTSTSKSIKPLQQNNLDKQKTVPRKVITPEDRLSTWGETLAEMPSSMEAEFGSKSLSEETRKFITDVGSSSASYLQEEESDDYLAKGMTNNDERTSIKFQTLNMAQPDEKERYQLLPPSERPGTDDVGHDRIGLSERSSGNHVSETQPLSEVGLLNDYVTMEKTRTGNTKPKEDNDFISTDGTVTQQKEQFPAESRLGKQNEPNQKDLEIPISPSLLNNKQDPQKMIPDTTSAELTPDVSLPCVQKLNNEDGDDNTVDDKSSRDPSCQSLEPYSKPAKDVDVTDKKGCSQDDISSECSDMKIGAEKSHTNLKDHSMDELDPDQTHILSSSSNCIPIQTTVSLVHMSTDKKETGVGIVNPKETASVTSSTSNSRESIDHCPNTIENVDTSDKEPEPGIKEKSITEYLENRDCSIVTERTLTASGAAHVKDTGLLSTPDSEHDPFQGNPSTDTISSTRHDPKHPSTKARDKPKSTHFSGEGTETPASAEPLKPIGTQLPVENVGTTIVYIYNSNHIRIQGENNVHVDNDKSESPREQRSTESYGTKPEDTIPDWLPPHRQKTQPMVGDRKPKQQPVNQNLPAGASSKSSDLKMIKQGESTPEYTSCSSSVTDFTKSSSTYPVLTPKSDKADSTGTDSDDLIIDRTDNKVSSKTSKDSGKSVTCDGDVCPETLTEQITTEENGRPRKMKSKTRGCFPFRCGGRKKKKEKIQLAEVSS